MVLSGPKSIKVFPLTLEVFEREREVIKKFDCGVSSLNQFLKDKRKCIGHLTERIAKSYLVYDGDTLVGYYCLSAGAIRATDTIRSQYKSWKAYSTYPAVVIGRFAIHIDVAHVGYGSSTMDYIKRPRQRRYHTDYVLRHQPFVCVNIFGSINYFSKNICGIYKHFTIFARLV